MYYLTKKTQNNPWSLFDEIDRVFGDWTPALCDRATALNRFVPKIDVSETEKQIKVSAELPGVDEKDVTVEMEDNVITIRGEKKSDQEEEGENWYRREQTYGSFERGIPLPDGINTDKVKAKFRKGKLTVTLPKVKQEEPKPKAIAIES